MDFVQKLHELATQIPRLEQRGLIKTQEGTKQALILPFISALGYSVFDPDEVTPELPEDVSIRQGEKADYAILRDGKAIMVFECKSLQTDLNQVQPAALPRYFATTDTRIGVLTNGVVYEFYTDLDTPGRMDEVPFLIFTIQDSTTQMGEMMKLFTRQSFDLETITSIAIDLKYTNLIKQVIADEMKQPGEALVQYFASQVYSIPLTPARQAQFADIIQHAWLELLGQPDESSEPPPMAVLVEEAMPSLPKWPRAEAAPTPVKTPAAEPVASASGSRMVAAAAKATPPPFPDTKTILSDPGLEAFRIIREIAQNAVGNKHVLMRDAQGYCYLVHNNGTRRRVAICRLYLNGGQKMLGLFDEHQEEHQFPLERIEDLREYTEQIRAIVRYCDAMLEMA